MNRRRIAVAAVVALTATGAAVWTGLNGGASAEAVLTATGTVEVREADLGFRAAGRIGDVRYREGDTVAAGAVLARLDVAGLEARRASAAARLAAARARLAELRGGARPEELAQARAALTSAERRRSDAQRDLERTRRLHEGGAVSRQALERAETALELAESEHEQARERYRMLERGPRAERIEAQAAAMRGAEAALAQVDALLADAVVRAPFAGRVSIRHREPGETVAPGSPVLTLMDPADRWVRIYIPEDRLTRIAVGQPATITVDGRPDRSYAGRVVFIADRAEFTPRNVQTPEERVRLVYAVKVEVTDDPELHLKPGLPVDVRLGEAAE